MRVKQLVDIPLRSIRPYSPTDRRPTENLLLLKSQVLPFQPVSPSILQRAEASFTLHHQQGGSSIRQGTHIDRILPGLPFHRFPERDVIGNIHSHLETTRQDQYQHPAFHDPYDIRTFWRVVLRIKDLHRSPKAVCPDKILEFFRMNQALQISPIVHGLTPIRNTMSDVWLGEIRP